MGRYIAGCGRFLALLVGVTVLAFILFELGPEATYSQLGKNPSEQQVAELRAQLGYDQPTPVRYLRFCRDLITLQFGHSWSNGEAVTDVLKRAVPVSILAVLPGFLLGNLVGLGLALWAAVALGRWPDRLINLISAVGMSVSFVIVMIAAQLLLGSSSGWSWLPSRGWVVTDFSSYLNYVTLPSLVIGFASFGYSARYYRSLLVNERAQPYVTTARAFGATDFTIVTRHVLPNTWLPLLSRILFSLPVVCVSGSILVESYFGIPGIGLATFNAINASDEPVLRAVVVLAAVLFGSMLFVADSIYRTVDPRAFRSP